MGCSLMVPEAIFIVKFNIRFKNLSKFYLSPLILWQGCQIAIVDVLLDRSTHYFCNEVLDDGSGRHFYSKIQYPA